MVTDAYVLNYVVWVSRPGGQASGFPASFNLYSSIEGEVCVKTACLCTLTLVP